MLIQVDRFAYFCLAKVSEAKVAPFRLPELRSGSEYGSEGGRRVKEGFAIVGSTSRVSSTCFACFCSALAEQKHPELRAV